MPAIKINKQIMCCTSWQWPWTANQWMSPNLLLPKITDLTSPDISHISLSSSTGEDCCMAVISIWTERSNTSQRWQDQMEQEITSTWNRWMPNKVYVLTIVTQRWLSPVFFYRSKREVQSDGEYSVFISFSALCPLLSPCLLILI